MRPLYSFRLFPQVTIQHKALHHVSSRLPQRFGLQLLPSYRLGVVVHRGYFECVFNAQRFEKLQRLIELIEKHVFTVNQMLKAPLTAFLSCMHGKTWASLSNLPHFLSNPSGRQASPHIILADKENKQNAWSDDGLGRFVLYLTLDLTISPHSPEVGNATMSVI